MMAASGLLAALALLLSVQACGTTASATTTVAGPTQALALKVFQNYLTAQRVAVANHDALLAGTLTSSSQYTLVATQWAAAGNHGPAVTNPTYGKPTLYVPKLTTYPQWFMLTAPKYENGRSQGTALMVFDRPDAASSWLLDGSVMLRSGAPALNITVKNGYATALRTTATDLAFRPDEVGATHASVVDEGPSSAAAPVVTPGPLTTGLYQDLANTRHQQRATGSSYSWEMEGTTYPFFALRTNDGGAVVLYTMSLNTVTEAMQPTPTRSIAVPDDAKPLLPVGQVRITRTLTVDYTQQYLTVDPPPAKNGASPGKIDVVGSVSGVTYAAGTGLKKAASAS
jgi:hypothetical protein